MDRAVLDRDPKRLSAQHLRFALPHDTLPRLSTGLVLTTFVVEVKHGIANSTTKVEHRRNHNEFPASGCGGSGVGRRWTEGAVRAVSSPRARRRSPPGALRLR